MTDRAWLAAATMAMVFGAGCLDGGDGGDRAPGGRGIAGLPEAVPHDATGCSMGVLVLLREAALLAPFLPDGFVPADAQGLLGTPAPVGMGAAVLTAYHCDHSAWLGGPLDAGEVNILVEDPGLGGDAPADDHYYLAEVTTAAGALSGRLREDGWTVVDGTSQVAAEGAGPGALSIDVRGAGPSYAASLTGLVPNALSGSSRFWHATPHGPSWFDYTVDADVLVGAAEARYGPGTLAASLAAAEGPPALGIAVPAFDWQARYQPPAGP